MKNVYIIVGHPSQDSFSHKLANEYENKLKQLNINVRRDNLNKLNFDLILRSKDHKFRTMFNWCTRKHKMSKWNNIFLSFMVRKYSCIIKRIYWSCFFTKFCI